MAYWRHFISILIACASLPLPQLYAEQASAVVPFDYNELTHKVQLDSLRGGYHRGGSEQPIYRIVVMAQALLIRGDQLELPLEKRKHLDRELGTIFEGEVTALDQLEIKKPLSLTINGSAIRQLVVHAMEEFDVPEDDVAVAIDVQILQQKKLLYVWPQFSPLTRTGYFLIPEKKPRKAASQPRTFHMEDPSGMIAQISSLFDPPKNTALSESTQPTDQKSGN